MRYAQTALRKPQACASTDRLFTGQRWDASIGLYDYNARYYDPALGRFISADTIVPEPANPQSLNRYAYVLNNPLRYVDPTGHFEVPMDDEGNLIPVCGELCGLLGFESFNDFAQWWEQLDSAHWKNILQAASWGDMIAFTNSHDNSRIRLIFARMFGGSPGVPNLRDPGALQNSQLVFWDLDAGRSLHFLVGQGLWSRGSNHQFARLGSSSHPSNGHMVIGQNEYLYFDNDYRRGQREGGWLGLGLVAGVYGLATGNAPVSALGWALVAFTVADMAVDIANFNAELSQPPEGPAYVHQGHPLDRRWENLMSSHAGH